MITSLFSTGESSPRRALRSLLFFIDRGVPSLKVFGLLIFGLPPFSILISRSYHGHTRFHFDTECRSFFCLTFPFLFSFTVLFFLNFRVNDALSVSGTGPCAPKPLLYPAMGVSYAVAAHPEPASPCRTIPCNPSPRGSPHRSPHPLFHAFGVPHASGTITQPDPTIVGIG